MYLCSMFWDDLVKSLYVETSLCIYMKAKITQISLFHTRAEEAGDVNSVCIYLYIYFYCFDNL